MLLCKESLMVITNGEADIRPAPLVKIPKGDFAWKHTDVTVDKEGCDDLF